MNSPNQNEVKHNGKINESQVFICNKFFHEI